MTKILLYRRLLAVTKKYWAAFLIGVFATIALSFSDASLAWLIKPIVNKGFVDKDTAFIRVLPLFIFLIFAVRAVSSFCSNYFIFRVSRSVVRNFRCQLFSKLMKLPAQFFDSHPSGKLMSVLIYNVEQVSQASSDVLITLLREFSLVVWLIVVMFLVNWKLSLIFVLITPLVVWGIKVCSKRLRMLSSRVQDSVAEVSNITKEGIETYRIIRLFSGQKFEESKFSRATQSNLHQELKVAVTNSVGTSMIQLLISVPLAIILALAPTPLFGVSAGSFAALISAMVLLIRPMRRVTNLNTAIQRGLAGAESVFQLLDADTEKDHGKLEIERVKGDITYNDVNFSYQTAQCSALRDINFKISAGQTVAIVGHSGGGKSTLINLLPRFYEPSSGQITIDGLDIEDFTLKSLRDQFALVSQDTVLFDDTVAANIAYAQKDSIDEAHLIQTAKFANALEFIEALPQGFNTRVGENGLLLSGGQRQRIAIARALYKKAPILILDEATSSLDTKSDQEIQVALNRLMSYCTTLVIAHRLSTIKNADWILVMDSGQIIERGRHEDLLAQDGVYKQLYKMQFSRDEPEKID